MPRSTLYRWDPALARYRDRAGRIVSRADVRRDIDTAIRNTDNEARALADQYRKGEITLGRWEREMRTLVKNTHMLNAAAAKGGWDQLTQSDYGRVGQIVREEYNHLDGFAGELAAGFQRTDGTMNSRAQLYARAGRGTYEKTSRAVAQASGAQLCKSITHPADHCSECLEQEALGWQPIDSGLIVPPGERICRSNCKCTLSYR